MAISDATIAETLSSYLERFPAEAEALAEPVRLLGEGSGFASRRSFPMHVTVGALLVCGSEVLLIDHLAYGITLQPGGHLEPTDATLPEAALRELTEETGIDERKIVALSSVPVYVEYGLVPARPEKDEPEHYHLDIGYAFSTERAEIGLIQETEVTGAAWYSVDLAVSLVGERIARAVGVPAQVL
ncbi:NUDIX domain-containing protein [Streptomyces kaniharaensis]|uniref:NUDIX domain-containing protein n=1 Tax=Streptomyces kaniharaensis TaxID=212423 RepID=A0A6N7L4N7_9ACTN|nr:NUDIX domain-containing protein [Streptomyces kaniharaensis]MQS17618.1 NUDIX domain-containing protein [Streptomyces kaniharaensis]